MELTTRTVLEYSCPLLLFLAVYFLYNRPRLALPGPYGLPFLGHLTLLGKSPHRTLTRWRKQYGDIYQIRLGSWRTVVLNGKSLIKEALVQRADDFSGRPPFYSAKQVTGGKNITFGNFDSSWIKHRQIASSVLYTFANARKNPVEDIIHEEVRKLVEVFLENDSHPFDPKENILFAAAGVIFQICYGKTNNIELDDEFRKFVTTTRDFNDFVNAGNPVDMMPWLRFIFGRKTEKFFGVVERAESFRKKRVAEHKETINKEHLRDVTDGLIAAVDNLPKSEMDALGLTEEQIMSTLDNLFGAGFDTVANTLHWTFLLLSSFPDVQQRVYREIRDVIGTSRPPCLSDKSKMPFTEATTAETLRYSGLFVMAIPHYTTAETMVGGFQIPKSTVVLLNFYSVTHDEDVWGDPFNFRPDRFLDEDGQLMKSVLDRFIPFSTGRRRCVAEFLARLELFLLLTGIVQLCEIQKPDGDERDMEPVFEMALRPKPFRIIIRKRQ